MGLMLAMVATFQTKAQCFTPAYPSGNMILDPGFDSTTLAKGGYGGWGPTAISPNGVCGSSAYIRGTCWPNGGSLDRALSSLKALTKYRVRAMVKSQASTGKTFQIQIEGVDGATSKFIYIGKTEGWKQIDTTFTTGATLGGTKGMYFNSCSNASPALTDTAWIDNYEMYAVPKVYTSPASLTFLGVGSKKVAVRAESLSQPITVTASTGFTVSLSSMPATVSGGTSDSLAITFNSATSKSGYIYFTSGSVKDSMAVTGTLAPALATSPQYVSLDEVNNSGTFTVTGGNLITGITMTAPAGITLSPSSLPSTANGTTVTATYDGNAISTGYITLTSGTATAKVRVRATRNADTFTPLYPAATNLISDPYFNNIASFDGWGTKSINTDTLYVYGGSKSGKVNAGGQCQGSLDKVLTGVMKPNTTYRVKAMVYAKGGSFQIGVYGWNSAKGDTTAVVSTTDSWQTVDFKFTTGATLKSSQGIFFNSCWIGGMTGYIDNWEAYEVPSIPTAINGVAQQTQKVYVSGRQIIADIVLAKESEVNVSVYNLQGKLVAKYNNWFEAGYNSKVVDSTLPQGIYIVKINSDEFSVSKKVIK